MTFVRFNLILRVSFTFFISMLPIAAQTTPPSNLADPSSNSSEDYATVSLATSSLRTSPPEVVDVTEETNYTREWLTVQWRPDDPIYLYVVRPKRIEKPPVVIYLYDYPAENDIYRDNGWCERVTSGGYAAVGFVPPLNGNRYHGVPMKEWFVSRLQESLAKSAHDVQMVFNYLGSRGDLDMNRVGMYGVGAGATIAALAASVDSRIKAIDLIDPWGDWQTWIRISDVVPDAERPLYLKEDFLKHVMDFDPVIVLPKLRATRVRLVQFGQGSVTPTAAQKRIAGALPENSAFLQLATPAEFGGESSSRALQWIKSRLDRSAAPIQSTSQTTRHKGENH